MTLREKPTTLSRRDTLKLIPASGLVASGLWTTTSIIANAGTVRVTLDVREVDGAYTYNGVSPGQTIVAEPGGTIDVKLINNLPPLHDDCTDDPNNFHGLNTTNLHTHGLHVSPTTDSSGAFDADNVFLSVVPRGQIVPCDEICGEDVKATFRWHETQYRFELPEDHPSGTFWYHAHKHGSTQMQVGGGLAGPIIVKDRPGAMPAYIEQADEKILVIMNEGVVLADPKGGGDLNPILKMRPGEVQRWRIINAQSSGQGGGAFARLSTNVPDLEMYQIAFDGITLSQRIAIDQSDKDEPWLNPAALAPGNRMDVMVRVPNDASTQSIIMDIALSISDLTDILSSTKRIGLKIEVSGDPVSDPWSDDPSLPGSKFEEFSNEALPRRVIRFQGGFMVDGEQYSGDVTQTMKLGTAEEWTIENNTNAVHAHHIHVNPFLITHINGIELAKDDPLRRWQDTIALPFATRDGPGSITYKTRFERFTGKFVIHCHVLRHEDRGMMQVVEIVP